ncbi:hypothetical protein ACE1TI_09775 [Alteribacillus sp. JSM 102045]|uniref:hypothetical protein n=1 Tax=Alteribacillus sp. JSM 102045 TaxID=1562101 RepID=UPI0035C175FB
MDWFDDPGGQCTYYSYSPPLISTLHYGFLNSYGMKTLRSHHSAESEHWREVAEKQEKRNLLQKLHLKNMDLKVFPYSGYYPLPFEEDLWTDPYLNRCKCWIRPLFQCGPVLFSFKFSLIKNKNSGFILT